MDINNLKAIDMPVLPLRDVVVYPHMVIPLFVGRSKSIKCLEAALDNNKKIILVAQKDANKDDPEIQDLFSIGTLSSILQMLKLPDGTIKVLVEGLHRVHIKDIKDNGKYFIAKMDIYYTSIIEDKEKIAFKRTIINNFEKYAKLNKKISSEIFISLNNISDISRLIDTISSHMPLKLKDKQFILETKEISKRLEHLLLIIASEIDLLKIEKSIKNRIKKQIEKSQKEYYLNEQIKAIKKELKKIDNIPDENEKLKVRINSTNMTIEAKRKIEAEFKKLKMMSPISAEATVVRSYIDWMLSIPWKNRSRIKRDLIKSQNILNKDHYGLDSIKERILEHLALQNRVNRIKGPILCLVGPPGVGKTSLGKSIAKATGRKYLRMSLGGIRDEAEIRGHRRTYVGSMPGKLIQKISKIGVKNPLFLLDEIDKISSDIRGDPSSALLEVLDPEQNSSFNDHYLEVDYDLSEIMFVATANSIRNIPGPLLDRMEIINISGYSEIEKINIAYKYLLPKQIKYHSLKKNELTVEKSAIIDIIRYYTREAGVRNLEKAISKICRKTLKNILTKQCLKNNKVDNKSLSKFLGIKVFDYGKRNKKNFIGQVTGLAWTEFGGDLIIIEAVLVPGKGKLICTGSLGKVMQESIKTALTVVRSKSFILDIKENFYNINDIHVHIPEGATPKDGPSAGVAVCTAIISSLTNNPVKSEVAMTGEITLNGRILPIGGLKEKVLAAHRGGIKTILIPSSNNKDIENISDKIIGKLNIKKVNTIDEIILLSLQYNPFNKRH